MKEYKISEEKKASGEELGFECGGNSAEGKSEKHGLPKATDGLKNLKITDRKVEA